MIACNPLLPWDKLFHRPVLPKRVVSLRSGCSSLGRLISVTRWYRRGCFWNRAATAACRSAVDQSGLNQWSEKWKGSCRCPQTSPHIIRDNYTLLFLPPLPPLHSSPSLPGVARQPVSHTPRARLDDSTSHTSFCQTWTLQKQKELNALLHLFVHF